ncbi:MAG: hypothetical protein E7605_09185 [Ruminococcaceae bacterium]|nr:hypothetical protein [Oscillospiraceae bacterium]
MRAVRISLVLFLLMIALVVGSMVMNRYVSETMRQAVEELPAIPDEQAVLSVRTLTDFWGRWRGWMRPTMNQTVFRTVNDLVGDLGVYTPLLDGGIPEYAGARARLLSAIEEMSRPERAALDSLF